MTASNPTPHEVMTYLAAQSLTDPIAQRLYEKWNALPPAALIVDVQADLLRELLEHEVRGYGPWTGNMKARVRAALGEEPTRD